MTDRAESGSRSRTRRAILEAAVVVFAKRWTASLGDIATEAQVARSTLHRYFPDRDALIRALADDLLDLIDRTISEAQLDEGSAREALRRLITGWFDLAPRLFFLFNEPSFNTPDPVPWVKDFWERLDVAGKPIEALVTRGQTDGVFTGSLPGTWINRLLWWMVYIGSEAVTEGEMTRYAAPGIIIQTLETGILARPEGD
ncbi:TetR/AcrR family transcriptional regulator [Kribbella sp. NPDC050124]|uniref:TetR/AcrR family transcriptional regulator n=1 Tax=Kribbella sp. NPDC050124 TaxID=3364114 RepID=UPI0037B425AB